MDGFGSLGKQPGSQKVVPFVNMMKASECNKSLLVYIFCLFQTKPLLMQLYSRKPAAFFCYFETHISIITFGNCSGRFHLFTILFFILFWNNGIYERPD